MSIANVAAAKVKKKLLLKIFGAKAAIILVAVIGLTVVLLSYSEAARAACNGGVSPGVVQAPGLPALDAPPAAGDPDPTELEKFMWGKRELESRQNYTARSGSSSASGAYQYIDSTWNAPARKAIWSQYGDFPHAYLAPDVVQDAVARADFVAAWRTYKNWFQVAMVHYYPAWVSDPSKWDQVPHPEAGNRLTLREYAVKVLTVAGLAGDAPGGTDAASVACRNGYGSPYLGDGTAGSKAVESASKYVGLGYKYGGGHAPGAPWREGVDCSSFVFNAYRDLGISIGYWTGAQINNGVSIGTNMANARPGDLIILGRSRSDTSHVVMYHSYAGGKHIVLESNGAGEPCRADNPRYNSNPKCKGVGPPHPFADKRTILDIRRIVCSLDGSGNPVPCGATPTV